MKILVNDGIEPIGKKLLQEAGFEVDTNKIEQADLPSRLNEYDAICVRSATKVRKELIDACPNLKAIGRGGVGLDNIDVEYAISKGISVINTPAASSRSVGELTMAHMLSLSRFLYQSNRHMPVVGDTRFNDLKKEYAKGAELEGKYLGVIGLGRIGQETAKVGLGLGMNIIATDPFVKEVSVAVGPARFGFTTIIKTTDMDTLLAKADYISLHIPSVMWRQRDLFVAITSATVPTYGEEQDLDAVRALAAEPGRPVAMPACPLMHGTGWFMMLQNLSVGGLVVTLENRHLDIPELFDTIEAEGVQMIVIVGDAFAKPMLRALDAEPDRWDIASLFLMISSGVMWSEPVKQGLLAHNEGMFLMDAFSSSEALGMGQSVSSAGGTSGTAKFMLGANARVIDDGGNDVAPGSGEIGRVAVKGVTPIGYYKDETKSAATFVEIDGERYSIPGDYAQVDADGGLVLLGRGSQCINTGGEKVYPEEVEEVLKEHPAIADAVAVGVPDDKFGEAITAMVEPLPGATVDEADVIAHVKAHLAHYKAPKRVVVIDTIGRAPNGKVDYKRLKGEAADALGITG